MQITNSLAPSVCSGRPCTRTRKRVVVFDMAFSCPGDSRPPVAVTGAGSALAQALERSGAAEVVFMPRPFIEGGTLSLLEELQDRAIIFALSLFDSLMIEEQAEVREIARRFPEAKSILGGPSVNNEPDLLRLANLFPEATAFVKGAGNNVISPLVEAIAGPDIDTETAAELKGVYIKTGWFEHLDQRVNTLTSQELNDQPGLTAYAALLVDIEKTGHLELNTSCGCRYRCVACSHQFLKAPIYWTAERIITELRRIKGMIEGGALPEKARNILFRDDDFFQDQERAIRFLSLVLTDPALKNYFQFSFQGSVGSFYRKGELNLELLDLLGRIRTERIEFGTDGFHNEAIKYLGKRGYTWEMAVRLMEEIDKRDIRQNHWCILTYPQVTREVLIKSLENLMAVSNRFSSVRLTINLFATAFESNQLMREALELEKSYGSYIPRIFSISGDEKKLPIDVPFYDPVLYWQYEAALRRSLTAKEILAEFGSRLREEDRTQLPDRLAKFQAQYGDSILAAVHKPNPQLQMFALTFLHRYLTGEPSGA